MITSKLKTAVAPLNGKNYPTWKIQCRMGLMKQKLWNIVDGTEAAPGEDNNRYAQFLPRRDRTLAIIVLSVEYSPLYLVGDPEDPATVRGKLENQFQKRTWAKKQELRCIRFALQLKNSESMQEHVKAVTEILDDLSLIEDPISKQDRVVHFATRSARLVQHAGYCS